MASCHWDKTLYYIVNLSIWSTAASTAFGGCVVTCRWNGEGEGRECSTGRDPCLFLEASPGGPKVSVRGPSTAVPSLSFDGICLFQLFNWCLTSRRTDLFIHSLRRPHTRLTRSVGIAASLSTLSPGSLSQTLPDSKPISHCTGIKSKS